MARTLLRFVLALAFRLRVEGDGRPLPSGRVIIVANHDSLLDAVLLGIFLPHEPTVAVTPRELRDPLIRMLLRAVPHVIVDPARPWSLKKLLQLVMQGRPVVVFPQLYPTPTGGMTKVYDAAARIAARHDAVIVPVHIRGALYSRYSVVGGNYPKQRFPQR